MTLATAPSNATPMSEATDPQTLPGAPVAVESAGEIENALRFYGLAPAASPPLGCPDDKVMS